MIPAPTPAVSAESSPGTLLGNRGVGVTSWAAARCSGGHGPRARRR